MTHIIYIKQDGTAAIERTKTNPSMIEMPDGYHPITNNSYWQDAERKRDPVLIIIQGVRGPYGATMENEDVSRLLYDLEVKERAFKKPGVSKMWMRMFERFFDWLRRYGIWIFVIGFMAYFTIPAMLGAY
jgi:hypothetical protein